MFLRSDMVGTQNDGLDEADMMVRTREREGRRGGREGGREEGMAYLQQCCDDDDRASHQLVYGHCDVE